MDHLLVGGWMLAALAQPKRRCSHHFRSEECSLVTTGHRIYSTTASMNQTTSSSGYPEGYPEGCLRRVVRCSARRCAIQLLLPRLPLLRREFETETKGYMT